MYYYSELDMIHLHDQCKVSYIRVTHAAVHGGHGAETAGKQTVSDLLGHQEYCQILLW